MDIKKETTPSKVVIIPRPPRCMDPDLKPVEPVAPAPSQQDAEPVAAPVAPGAPLNNQVEGPVEGLAGVPAEEAGEK